MRNESTPASVFDTVIAVMSGAAAFSPDESWYVGLFAAIAVGAENAPDAAVGRATTATAVARTSPGRVSGRTTRVSVVAPHAGRN